MWCLRFQGPAVLRLPDSHLQKRWFENLRIVCDYRMVRIRIPFRVFEFLLNFLDVNENVVGPSEDGICFKCDVLCVRSE